MINIIHNSCVNCSIHNVIEENVFSDEEKKLFINDVYSGIISNESLSEKIYLKSAIILSEQFDKGYNDYLIDETYNELILSIYAFCAAKQYQCVSEIIKLKRSDVSYDDYFESAKKIFDMFYVKYFSAEMEQAEIQGESVKRWFILTKDEEK